MKRLSKQYIYLSVLATTGVIFLGFPLKVKAEWYVVGYDRYDYAVYMNDESVVAKGEIRRAEVRFEDTGRALFVINCETNSYYIQSNTGRREGYAEPGTIAGLLADEMCYKYRRK
ncbi:MAG: hypothetical protein CLLPBCKN_006447 [Chroococcidiopsis cubana SAG 39.79]|uniref:SH3b domain-containing protein n=1 Tax=Chroococcidiopsis cubana SAG 39.79 TaxID=388085 RepID=A0AB37UGR0_9CYAN|nr:hypothetical protein [Chroococcidiopsis cubana]MDZ4877012.1 hypothetical protein [Chroococcidiopsis cubana SAG 39.79]PSB57464.1 hypothetical protein C7B79_30955 [Chroococcidiopsis cubana CCALA 043]RUT10757.1 hypothetical protein DSM107010_39970 [Chroococcidiopsis cubana SAG 39.79]